MVNSAGLGAKCLISLPNCRGIKFEASPKAHEGKREVNIWQKSDEQVHERREVRSAILVKTGHRKKEISTLIKYYLSFN